MPTRFESEVKEVVREDCEEIVKKLRLTDAFCAEDKRREKRRKNNKKRKSIKNKNLSFQWNTKELVSVASIKKCLHNYSKRYIYNIKRCTYRWRTYV